MIFYDKDMMRYNTNDISEYQLVNSKKSGGSIIARGGLGMLALGPVGLLAGATAKNKCSVLLIYKSGSKKMVTLKEKDLKILMENVWKRK